MIFFLQRCNSRQVVSRWLSCIFGVLGSWEGYWSTLIAKRVKLYRACPGIIMIMQVFVNGANCVRNCLFKLQWIRFVHFKWHSNGLAAFFALSPLLDPQLLQDITRWATTWVEAARLCFCRLIIAARTASNCVASLIVVIFTDDPWLVLNPKDTHTCDGWLWHLKFKPTQVSPVLLRSLHCSNCLLILRLLRLFQDRLCRQDIIHVVIR